MFGSAVDVPREYIPVRIFTLTYQSIPRSAKSSNSRGVEFHRSAAETWLPPVAVFMSEKVSSVNIVGMDIDVRVADKRDIASFIEHQQRLTIPGPLPGLAMMNLLLELLNLTFDEIPQSHKRIIGEFQDSSDEVDGSPRPWKRTYLGYHNTVVDYQENKISPVWVFAWLAVAPIGFVVFYFNPMLFPVILVGFPCASILLMIFGALLWKGTCWTKVTRAVAITLVIMNLAIVAGYCYVVSVMDNGKWQESSNRPLTSNRFGRINVSAFLGSSKPKS